MSSKISPLGPFLAPAIYAVGRLLERPDVAVSSVRFDPQFFRGYEIKLAAEKRSGDIMRQLSIAARLCSLAGDQADRIILEFISRSHSQLLQDIVCLLAHNKKRNGFFVEIGVGNGVTYSNSLLLERDLDWRGLLADPARKFHDQIRSGRTSPLDTRAIWSVSGDKIIFEEDNATGEHSGVAGRRKMRAAEEILNYQVETVTLDDLLSEQGAPDVIDYMSIDTEGAEIEVLKGLSLSRRQVGLFTIEHSYVKGKADMLRSMLKPLGYVEILPELSAFDIWFLHRDVASSYLP